MKDENNTVEMPRSARRLATCFDWVGSAVTALVAVALLFALAFRVVSVDGESMTNTLQHGDRLIISGTFYSPAYGDVVVISQDNGVPLIKRVIGLPGDRIRIDQATYTVYRNDVALEEGYTRDGTTPPKGMTKEITVPEGHIFVLGDNRWDSYDSRAKGPIPIEDVLGRALFRLAPNPMILTNGE